MGVILVQSARAVRCDHMEASRSRVGAASGVPSELAVAVAEWTMAHLRAGDDIVPLRKLPNK